MKIVILKFYGPFKSLSRKKITIVLTKLSKMKKFLSILSIVLIAAVLINACKHEPAQIAINPTPIPGPVPNNGVCFESDVLPLFQTNCAKSGCHDATSHVEDLVLDSYTNIVKKGIVPGKANSSKLYEVLFKSGSDKMPPLPNADLTTDQRTLLENG